MIILHQEIRAKPEKCDEVMAALAAIIPGARATEGVIKLDIARDLLDPDSFVATGVYEDGAAQTTGVGSRGAHGHGDVCRLAGRSARSTDLRRVARPDPRLISTAAASEAARCAERQPCAACCGASTSPRRAARAVKAGSGDTSPGVGEGAG
jgi:hypothetical protein